MEIFAKEVRILHTIAAGMKGMNTNLNVYIFILPPVIFNLIVLE